MQLKLNTSLPSRTGARALLAAALLCGVAAANAAAGYSVNQKQESLVTVGMSQTDVQQAIGRPSRKVQFGNEPGPTWTYDVAGVADQATLFDVDFGSDGKVASISERLDETGH